jgi:hypothetical protein
MEQKFERRHFVLEVPIVRKRQHEATENKKQVDRQITKSRLPDLKGPAEVEEYNHQRGDAAERIQRYKPGPSCP